MPPFGAPVIGSVLMFALSAAGDPPVVQWFDPDEPSVAPTHRPLRIDLGGRTVPTNDPVELHQAPPIQIDVVDADIRSVLRLLSAASGLNFVVPDHVSATVTVQLTDVPWDLALAAILSAEGLQAVPFGDDVVLIEPLSGTR